MPTLAFKIRNDLNDLRGVAAATTEFLETNRASQEVIFAANLAIEEMVSNTVKYGYSDGLQHQIDIQLSARHKRPRNRNLRRRRSLRSLCLPGTAPFIAR